MYLTYENIKQYGLISGLQQSPPLGNGILFPLQGALFFFIAGASRWSALLINFIYFVILQAVCITTIRSVSKNIYLLILFVGILLSINTPFLPMGGGMFDVRLDFIAFCLYGVFVCSAIRSDFFLKRGWVVLLASIASLTILLRSITLLYFTGIVGCFVLYLVYLSSRNFAQQNVRDPSTTGSTLKRSWIPDKRYAFSEMTEGGTFAGLTAQRLLNLVIFYAIIAVVTLPLIWLNRHMLYKYYVVGHVVGNEKYIRLAEFGLRNTFDEIIYYPKMVLGAHIGYFR